MHLSNNKALLLFFGIIKIFYEYYQVSKDTKSQDILVTC